jgi:hypothetical protein
VKFKNPFKHKSSYEDRAWLKDDAVLYVEGFLEPVYLYRLRRTIKNSVRSLDEFNNWLEKLPPIVDVPSNTSRAAAYNYLERTRESLRGLSEIMNADDIYSPIQDAARDLAEARSKKIIGSNKMRD